LTKGKAAVIAEVAAEMLRRDPQGHKTHVALTDGERALQILVNQKLQVTLILDLLHVLEKLWKAAYVFHAEGSPEAQQWVRLRAERILQRQVSRVVQGMRQSVTKLGLGGNKAKTLSSVADYLYRNRTRMRYHQYLAAGWPIASGPVEGACKNLIKDRMERSGMRWTQAMAEAIVQLRAIYLSEDLDRYWSFHIHTDQERLHPPGKWSVVEKQSHPKEIITSASYSIASARAGQAFPCATNSSEHLQARGLRLAAQQVFDADLPFTRDIVVRQRQKFDGAAVGRQ
jgi:hypothetical protein